LRSAPLVPRLAESLYQEDTPTVEREGPPSLDAPATANLGGEAHVRADTSDLNRMAPRVTTYGS
jgi:hypothetical protein